jgi:hypothetical protein
MKEVTLYGPGRDDHRERCLMVFQLNKTLLFVVNVAICLAAVIKSLIEHPLINKGIDIPAKSYFSLVACLLTDFPNQLEILVLETAFTTP